MSDVDEMVSDADARMMARCSSFYGVEGEGDCIGRWAERTTHIIDTSRAISPLELCLIAPAERLAKQMREETGVDGAIKVFLGRDGDGVILGTIHPAEAVRVPLENIGALHRVAEADSALFLKQDEMLSFYKIAEFATDDPIEPINPAWRPSNAMATQQLNYIRLLGGMTISALPDLARPIGVYGLTRTFTKGWVPFLTAFKTHRLAAAEVKKAGTALDMVLDTRARAMADLFGDWQRGTKFERVLEGATSRFGLVTLMAPWNAVMKQISGTIGIDYYLRSAKAISTGKATQRQIEDMAANGIDEEMAKRIWQQFENGGGSIQRGLYLSNTEDWTDRKALEAFRAAIVRDVDRAIVTPGLERPLFMSKPWGKIVGQFKSFAFASTQRVLIAGLQRPDAAFLNMVVLMFALGGVATWIRAHTTGFDTSKWSTAKWATESVDRSGVLAIFSEANNIAEKVTRGRVGLSAFTGEMASRYQSRNAVGALTGPTFDLASDAIGVTGSAFAGDWAASDSRAVRKILPYQNLFYLRRLFDQVEGGVNGALGVPQRRKQ